MAEKQIQGELILIDNDKFEKDFLYEALQRLDYKVPVVHLFTAEDGLEYLTATEKQIFLIISEIKFTGMDGFHLKMAINESQATQWKSTPFIFISNNATKEEINEAYKHDIHGFFKKPERMEDLTHMFSVIIQYWILNMHPNRNVDF